MGVCKNLSCRREGHFFCVGKGGTRIFCAWGRGQKSFVHAKGEPEKLVTGHHKQTPPPSKNDSSLNEWCLTGNMTVLMQRGFIDLMSESIQAAYNNKRWKLSSVNLAMLKPTFGPLTLTIT